MDAIQKLASILQQVSAAASAAAADGPSGGSSSSAVGDGQAHTSAILCGCMEALAKVCFHHDTCRLQLMKAGVLRLVLDSFNH